MTQRWNVFVTVRDRHRGGAIKEMGPYYVTARDTDEASYKAAMMCTGNDRYTFLIARAEQHSPEHAESEEFLSALRELDAQDYRHPDTIGIYRRPEPKSIHDPAPKARIRREPPRPRNKPDKMADDATLPSGTHKPKLTHPWVERSVNGHVYRFYRG